MPRKRLAPKSDGLHRITVMIPAAEATALGAEADREKRPLSEIVRRRLAGAGSAGDESLSPRARALGRLLGYLSNELMAYSPPGNEGDYIKRGINRLLDHLASAKLRGPEDDAEMMADYWWLSLNNADARVYHDGKPMPLTPELQALVEIRDALLPSADRTARAASRRKERR